MMGIPINLNLFKKAHSNRQAPFVTLVCLMGLLTSCIHSHLAPLNIPHPPQDINIAIESSNEKPGLAPEDLEAHIDLLKDAHKQIGKLKKAIEQNRQNMKLEIEIHPPAGNEWNPQLLEAIEKDIQKVLTGIQTLENTGTAHEGNQEKLIESVKSSLGEIKTLIIQTAPEANSEPCDKCEEDLKIILSTLEKIIQGLEIISNKIDDKKDPIDIWKISFLALIVALSAYIANIRANIIGMISKETLLIKEDSISLWNKYGYRIIEALKKIRSHEERKRKLKERLFFLLFADVPLIIAGIFLSIEIARNYISSKHGGSLWLESGLAFFFTAVLVMSIHHAFEWGKSKGPGWKILKKDKVFVILLLIVIVIFHIIFFQDPK